MFFFNVFLVDILSEKKDRKKTEKKCEHVSKPTNSAVLKWSADGFNVVFFPQRSKKLKFKKREPN